MQQQTRRRGVGRMRVVTTGVAFAAIAVTAAATLSACTSGTGGQSDDQSPAGGTPTGSTSSHPYAAAKAAAAVITDSVKPEKPASPGDPIDVKIAHGTLTAVTLVNAAGKSVDGSMSSDKTTWHSTEKLGYDKTYKLSASGTNSEGRAVSHKTTIETIDPDNVTMPQITDTYGHTIGTGDTYGIGMLVRVHFDEMVNREKAERALSVTTTPKVVGGWYWSDRQNAWWRPKDYYPSGTKVSVKADVYGKKLNSGLYGQADQSASFTIGQKRLSVANGKTHEVKVYFDDKLVRTMPTSMGKGGYDPVTPSINFWTMKGNYTVLNHENPAIMSSGSFGVQKGSPNYYKNLKVPWSTKVSTSGTYLHEFNETASAQGHRNVSHGCLNLNTKNAKWFYQHSRIGDVVQMVKTGGPTITFNQGGQWSVSWADWQKGSFLS